jgi:hypothetical protein
MYLFIMLGLFNGTFNISDYTALTVKWLVNNELERIWKEAVMV